MAILLDKTCANDNPILHVILEEAINKKWPGYLRAFLLTIDYNKIPWMPLNTNTYFLVVVNGYSRFKVKRQVFFVKVKFKGKVQW